MHEMAAQAGAHSGLCFVGGGARSGKTAIALAIASSVARPRYYIIATAQAYDDEMRVRIARHQHEREGEFTTVEAPYAVAPALQELGSQGAVVIDCLTLWLSNLILRGNDDDAVLAQVDQLIQVAQTRDALTVVISNEVGLGIVPDNPLARRFRDLSGWAHQRLAAQAKQVYWACFGLALRLLPAPMLVGAPGDVFTGAKRVSSTDDRSGVTGS